MKSITTRKGQIDDLSELQQLFAETVSNICKSDYNNKQIEAWISSIENKQRWHDILTKQFVLVALDKDKITGFCTLDDGNYIDLLYVHKDYQRQGVARKLYDNIEKEAKKQNQTKLTADASITAKSFFEGLGFKMLKEQTVKIKDVELTNFKMIKDIK